MPKHKTATKALLPSIQEPRHTVTFRLKVEAIHKLHHLSQAREMSQGRVVEALIEAAT